MHCILTNVDRRDRVLLGLAGVAGFTASADWNGITPPAIVGNDLGMDQVQRECNVKGIPYLYIDHAYLNRHPWLERFRLCVSSYHCNDWRASDRACPAKVRSWRKDGKHVVVIEPAKHVFKIYPVQTWIDKTMATLKTHTDRKIVLKAKGEGDLLQVLGNAWAVVCFGSVADVDAVRFGVPAFAEKTSPVYPVAQHDLSLIETPSYPDRVQWLQSLAASEWALNEMSSAWERIKPLWQSQLMRNCKPQSPIGRTGQTLEA